MSWDKEQVRLAAISGIVGAVAAGAVQFLSFGATYGRLLKSVEVLEKRVDGLEQKAMPGTKVGDLCLKLLDMYGKEPSRSVDIEQQLTKLRCYDGGVPAAYSERTEGNSEAGAEQGARASNAAGSR